MVKEVWKDIVGFEGLYQISNLGRVRSVNRTSDVDGRRIKERILIQHLNTKGYYCVVLRKGGKSYTKEVHRMVCLAFIPNPNGLEQVGHKDESRINNFVDNLEWVSREDNCNMPLRKQRLSKANVGKYVGNKNYFYNKHYCKGLNHKAKTVICENIIYDCILSCAEYYNISKSTMAYWLRNKEKMPKEWIEKGLKYIDE